MKRERKKNELRFTFFHCHQIIFQFLPRLPLTMHTNSTENNDKDEGEKSVSRMCECVSVVVVFSHRGW